MAEDLYVSQGTKEEKYRTLLPQVRALLDGEDSMIAALGNLAAALKETFGFLWVGFYRAVDGELRLYPFQGPVACTRLPYGRGVCGTAYAEQRTLIVPDVDAFPGHIACSSRARSEIVIPVYCKPHGEDVSVNPWGVLDIDSEQPDAFDKTDEQYLEAMLACLDFTVLNTHNI